jgi:RNA polymerase sigma-70 factor (ECF subfamily)
MEAPVSQLVREGVTPRIPLADPTQLDLDGHRAELTGYCYRMLGSTFEADDAVQETLLRAWQAVDRFEGRASLRSWLFRIATNVCLDALRGRKRRAIPMDLSSPVPCSTEPGDITPENVWVTPIADADAGLSAADPAERVIAQDSIRLAFVAALQHLPPRQRAVLLLREVLQWSAAEVAELLDTSVASVNSALQRARATIDARNVSADDPTGPLGDRERELLARYVQLFESYDIDGLVSLMHRDASISMPPYPFWLRGRDDLRGWYLGHGIGCKGSRLVPIAVNGSPGFAQYRASGPNGEHEPWSIQVLEISDGQVVHVHHFLDPALFARFGVPARLS